MKQVQHIWFICVCVCVLGQARPSDQSHSAGTLLTEHTEHPWRHECSVHGAAVPKTERTVDSMPARLDSSTK